MRETTHCIDCQALIYVDEQIHGYGLRCGCLKKYVLDMQKTIKKLEQPTLFDSLEVPNA